MNAAAAWMNWAGSLCLMELLYVTSVISCESEYIKNLSYRTITMSSLVEIPIPRGKYNEIKSAFLKNAFEDGQVTL